MQLVKQMIEEELVPSIVAKGEGIDTIVAEVKEEVAGIIVATETDVVDMRM